MIIDIVVFYICSDSCYILIGAFRPLTLKVIIDIVGLISIIFSICCALLRSIFSFYCLLWFWEFYDSIFSIVPAYWLCSSVCNIHLQLIELQFQITPYHITVEFLKQSISNFSFLSLIWSLFPIMTLYLCDLNRPTER